MFRLRPLRLARKLDSKYGMPPKGTRKGHPYLKVMMSSTANSRTATFFVNAGQQVGLGHLQRSLVIADALLGRGFACTFALPDAMLMDLVRRRGHWGTVWPENLSRLGPADVVVADSYTVDSNLCRAWASRFTVRAVVDDLADRPLEAEVIVNPNIYGTELRYAVPRECLVLGGPAYVLSSPAFAALRNVQRSAEPPEVIIAFGGTDDGRRAAAVARELIRCTGVPVGLHLVASPLLPPNQEAQDFAPRNPHVRLHHGASMPDLMARAVL
jgi:UDP-2,4-diacetamido-2,4,6-trideoxy-beta-L-altropyranose hydrolase